MGPSKLKKAIGAVKDQTSIGLAKVGNSASLSDLEVAIVKATRHEEYPAEEKYIREILSLTCYSRAYIAACVNIISRRLSRTRNWVVALKTLILVHRLLAEGDPAYEQEIFFATRRGTRLLNLSEFRDTSRSDSWDFSSFVRSYALYLDEQLEFKMQGRRGKRSAFGYFDSREEEVAPVPAGLRGTPVRDMRSDHIFARIQHLMQLIERLLTCRPTGEAKTNRVVLVAMYPIVKESFQVYYETTEILGILIDRFLDLQVTDAVKVHQIFCRIAKQYDELDAFYDWCKYVGIARSSDYPEVEKITNKKLEIMDEYIREKSQGGRNGNLNKHRENDEEERAVEEEEQESKEAETTVVEDDMTTMKALPPPEGFTEEVVEPKKSDQSTHQEEDSLLINLEEDGVTTQHHADSMALALFDGAPAATATGTIQAWDAFHESGDWEKALVESASHLSNQKMSLAGGFDMLMLDGMYQQGATAAAMASSGVIATGSASSIAFGSAGKPAMLALPAPDGNAGTLHPGADPFAASLAVAPPAFVQMSEMERKQRLLVEEQLMWQQYRRDGMQGHLGTTNTQQMAYPYNMGGAHSR